jgi:mechanosensitive ion channel-like protein
VQIGGSVGTVKELSLFWTELVTDDKVQIIVPNGGVWGQPLRNFSIYPAPPHAGEVRFRIAEGTEFEPALENVRAIVLPISLPCAECKQIHLTLGFWDRISISVDRCSCASSSDRLKVASIFLASSASAICPSRSSFATRASWRAT